MDYALAQLINDTNNPLSAIRGHSLLRDMYGNDSVFRGATRPANPAAETGGLLTTVYSQRPRSPRRSSSPGYQRSRHSRPVADAVLQPAPVPDQHPDHRPVLRARLHPLDRPDPARAANNGSNVNGSPRRPSRSSRTTPRRRIPRLHAQQQPDQPDGRPEAPNLSNRADTVPSDWTSFLYVDPNISATVTQCRLESTAAIPSPGRERAWPCDIGSTAISFIARRPVHAGLQRPAA